MIGSVVICLAVVSILLVVVLIVLLRRGWWRCRRQAGDEPTPCRRVRVTSDFIKDTIARENAWIREKLGQD